MPVLNGLEATRQILVANATARVLIFSGQSDDKYVDQARAVGSAGLLEKQASAGTLVRAIREVAKGNGFINPTTAKRMARRKKYPGLCDS